MRELTGGRAALISIPVVNGNFSVWMSGVQNPERSSKAELMAGGSGYWYDSSKRRIFFKLVEEGMVVGFDPT